MKLHLPKSLLVAVIASVCSVNNICVAVPTDPDAWHGEADKSTAWFIIGAAETAKISAYDDDAKDYGAYQIKDSNATYNGQKSVTELILAADKTTTFMNNWHSETDVDLQVSTLQFGEDGSGAGSIVVNENQKLVINTILSTSTVTSLNNMGTLSIGGSDTTTVFNGTVNNTGTLTLDGALRITSTDNFTYKLGEIEHYSKDGGTTQSVSGNGFAYSSAYRYYLVDGTGNSTVAAETITIGDTSGVVLDKTTENGKVSFTYGSGGYSSEYYVNESETMAMSTAGTYMLADDATLTFNDTINEYATKEVIGNGRVVASFATDDHSQSLALGTGFNGTLVIQSGQMDLRSFRMGESAVYELVSGQVWGNVTIDNEVKLNAANMDSAYDFAYSDIVLNGKVTGNYLQVTARGSDGALSLTNAENDIDAIRVTGRTLNMSGGTLGELEVSGGTAHLTGNVAIDGSAHTVTTNSIERYKGLYIKNTGTVNIGNGTDASTVTVARVEMGDARGETAGGGTLNVKANARLIVTGEDVSGQNFSYWRTGFMLGEWEASSTLHVVGTLLSQNASISCGDWTGYVNIDGLLATKGFTGVKHQPAADNTGTIDLSLSDGGTVVLGEGGIANIHNWKSKLGAGTVGISADCSIEENLSLCNAETGTTFNTAKYVWSGTGATTTITPGNEGGTLTISSVISDYVETNAEVASTYAGKLVKSGAGELVLSGANTYTGGTSINSGTLTTGSASALGKGAVSLGETGILKLNSALTVKSVATTGGAINLNGQTLTVSDGITGAVGKKLYVDGAGKLQVKGMNLSGTDQDLVLKANSSATVEVSGTANSVYVVDLSASNVSGTLLLKSGAQMSVQNNDSSQNRGALWMTANAGVSLEDTAKFTWCDTTITGTTRGTGTSVKVSEKGNASLFWDKTIISHADVEVNSGSEKSVAAKLVNSSLANMGSGKLTVSNPLNDFTGVNLKAISGSIELMNLTNGAALKDLKIDGDKQVGAYTGADSGTAKAAVSVSGQATFGAGAVLSANLTLESGSELVSVGGANGISLNQGILTLTLGGNIKLGEELQGMADALADGSYLVLFRDVGDFKLNPAPEAASLLSARSSDTDATTADAADVFKDLAPGEYIINLAQNRVLITALPIPEPTSSMLGLVGLVALTFRRRRK